MKKINKNNFSIILLVLIHAVGLIGLTSDFKEYFLILTPLNLIISLAILIFNQEEKSKQFIIFCCLVFDIGYIIEAIGVHTGIIFGEYTYGNTLGFKLFDVPLIIGINWLLLVYSVGNLINNISENLIFKSLSGALLLTILDYFIEPIAVKFDFWSWNQSEIPIQNYIAWFLVSFGMLLLFNKFSFSKNNLPAKMLYIIQIAFFVILNFI